MCAFKLLPMYCASVLVEKESPIRKLSDRLELVLQKWKNEREKCWNKPLPDAPLSRKLERKERCRLNPSEVARGGPVVKAKGGMQNLLEMLLARVAKTCFWLVPILFASNSRPACLRVKKPWNCQHGKKLLNNECSSREPLSSPLKDPQTYSSKQAIWLGKGSLLKPIIKANVVAPPSL